MSRSDFPGIIVYDFLVSINTSRPVPNLLTKSQKTGFPGVRRTPNLTRFGISGRDLGGNLLFFSIKNVASHLGFLPGVSSAAVAMFDRYVDLVGLSD